MFSIALPHILFQIKLVSLERMSELCALRLAFAFGQNLLVTIPELGAGTLTCFFQGDTLGTGFRNRELDRNGSLWYSQLACPSMKSLLLKWVGIKAVRTSFICKLLTNYFCCCYSLLNLILLFSFVVL